MSLPADTASHTSVRAAASIGAGGATVALEVTGVGAGAAVLGTVAVVAVALVWGCLIYRARKD